jgi:hypothetical protein
MLEKVTRHKHSSLLRKFVNFGQKKFYDIGHQANLKRKRMFKSFKSSVRFAFKKLIKKLNTLVERYIHICRLTDRQTDRQVGRQAQRQAGAEAGRGRGRQAQRQAGTEAGRQRGREAERQAGR